MGRDGCRVPLPWKVEGSPSASAPTVPTFRSRTGSAGTRWRLRTASKNSTLELYRKALKLRRELQAEEELEWIETGNPEVLHFSRPGGWQSVTNFGDTAVELPAGEVLISSAPLEGGMLPGNSTVWLR